MIILLNAVLRTLAMTILVAMAGHAVGQQTFPVKPIRIVIPFPPGGANTTVARLLGQKMTENWGPQVIVDNRPGGNSIIGTEYVAKSAPDGYTLTLISSAHVINSVLLPNLPYDSIRDFAAVATATSSGYVLALHPSLPVKNVREFIALAKSRSGQLNYASSGSGGVQHLAGELFNIVAKVKIQHIPYKGGGPAITELIGGQVDLMFANPANVIAYIQAGRLKGIAVSSNTRVSALPHLPTIAEAGLPGYEVKSWQGILAPASTPKEIIARLSSEVARILALADIREKMVSSGLEPYILSPDAFAALLKTETVKFAKVIQAANIRLEE